MVENLSMPIQSYSCKPTPYSRQRCKVNVRWGVIFGRLTNTRARIHSDRQTLPRTPEQKPAVYSQSVHAGDLPSHLGAMR